MTRFNTVHRGFTRCIIVHIYRWKNDCFTRNGNGRREWCGVFLSYMRIVQQASKQTRNQMHQMAFLFHEHKRSMKEDQRGCERKGSQSSSPHGLE